LELKGWLRLTPSSGPAIERPFHGSDYYRSSGNDAIEMRRTAISGPGSFGTELVKLLADLYGSRFLEGALGDPLPSIRSDAARQLGERGVKSSVDLLRAALKDDYDYVRESAAIALTSLGDPRAIPDLAAALTRSFGGNWRVKGVDLLAQFKGPQALEALNLVLAADDPRVQGAAARALAVRGDSRGCAFLATRLYDPKLGMVPMEYPEVVHLPNALLEATRSTGVSPNCLTVALRAAKEGNPAIRGKMIAAVGHAGSSADIEFVAAFLTDSQQDLRIEAAEALARLGDSRWKEATLTLLSARDLDPRYLGAGTSRERAAGILGEFGTSADLTALEPLLADEYDYVQKAAAAAIKRIKERSQPK
jgi:HEAT repeat protein